MNGWYVLSYIGIAILFLGLVFVAYIAYMVWPAFKKAWAFHKRDEGYAGRFHERFARSILNAHPYLNERGTTQVLDEPNTPRKIADEFKYLVALGEKEGFLEKGKYLW